MVCPRLGHVLLMFAALSLNLGCGGPSAEPPPPPVIANISPEVVIERPAGGTKLAATEALDIEGYVIVSDFDLVSFGGVLIEFFKGKVSLGMSEIKLEKGTDPHRFRFAGRLPAPKKPGRYSLGASAAIAKASGYSKDGKLTGIESEALVRSKPVQVEVKP